MPRREKRSIGREALTSIGEPIHCGATREEPPGQNEQDEIDINNFIKTLAEVAMAVAARRLAKNQVTN